MNRKTVRKRLLKKNVLLYRTWRVLISNTILRISIKWSIKSSLTTNSSQIGDEVVVVVEAAEVAVVVKMEKTKMIELKIKINMRKDLNQNKVV